MQATFLKSTYLCKSKLAANKQNFDLVRHCKRRQELAERDQEHSKHWASLVFGHRAGSCELAWAKDFGSDLRSTSKVPHRYKVSSERARKLWLEYKLAGNVFEEYPSLCKNAVAANKRNFDLVRHWRRERELAERA